jgi:16S rRNA (adenine1518-N6/adenine1519-N6)-dimethyltransferase
MNDKMYHPPRKRFGQNFLQNKHIINAIIHEMHPQPDDVVVEIGPGLGALTQPLLRRLHHLTAIEIDQDLQAHLKALPTANDKLTLIDADALTIDYQQFGEQTRIIGNLPYNISTPLLLRLLHSASQIADMHFMLQKEVVDRIVAPPGNKTYGRLSVMIQYYCEAESLFNVPSSAFYPQPKVESAIVRLIPYQNSPYPKVGFDDLERLVGTAFAMRRKTLANNLKSLLKAEEISALGIDPTRRPEQISVMEYVQLVKFIAN